MIVVKPLIVERRPHDAVVETGVTTKASGSLPAGPSYRAGATLAHAQRNEPITQYGDRLGGAGALLRYCE
jgi:hypothetical protein